MNKVFRDEFIVTCPHCHTEFDGQDYLESGIYECEDCRCRFKLIIEDDGYDIFYTTSEDIDD